jgi:RND family efflux transporter MFP subunit
VTSYKSIAIIAAAALVCAACSGNDDAAAAQPQQQTGRAAKAAPNRDAAGGAESSDEGNRTGGGRGQSSITLAATDIAVVKRGSIDEGVGITGDLRPIETVTVRARLEGDLVGVLVREGEHVKAGQLLARFEDSEQQSAVTSARADRIAAQSDLTTAQWNLEQTEELFKAGAVAERDFKLAQQTVASASARLAAAEARLKAATSLLNDTRAVATTTGVIQTRAVENGEHIARGATLFTLVRTNVLELAAAVPARFSGVVKVGQPVLFAADGRTFNGKVARVSPTVDPATRSVTVYVQIPNETLKGGTFAAGRVISRTIDKVLVVPTAAVRLAGDGKQFVYKLNGKIVDVANVQVGATDERIGVVEVLAGVAEGDRIIVGNVGSLGRGMQVTIAGEETAPTGGRRGAGATQSR